MEFSPYFLGYNPAQQHQQVIKPPPPRLQFFTSDVNAPCTTNHELFKVGAHYRATDDTTVNAYVTQTPPMVNPTKFEREVIPATLDVCAQVRNANDVLRDKTVTVTAQASMTEAGVFHKSAEVLISKETPKGFETGVFVGVSRSNGANTYHTGVRLFNKPK